MKKIFWFLVAGMMLSSCGLIDDLIGDDEEDEESSMEEPGGVEEAPLPEPGMNNTYRWLVERIEGEWVAETDNGEKREGKVTYDFEYDDFNRVIVMDVQRTESGEEGEVWDDMVVSFGYGEGGMATAEEYWHNGELEFAIETDYRTNEEGLVRQFVSWVTEDGMGYEEEGVMEHDSEWHAVYAQQGEDWYEADWMDGNLRSVTYLYDGSEGKECAEMRYDNPELANRMEVNVDFNWLFATSEWMTCWGFGTMGVKPFDLMGQRSALLMTEEYDEYEGRRTWYEYKLDGNACPVEVRAVTVAEDGSETMTAVYRIEYGEGLTMNDE